MEINSGNSINTAAVYTPAKVQSTVDTEVKVDPSQEQADSTNSQDREISNEELTKTTGDLNKLMQLLNADLKFVFHEGTQQLIVQVVDTKENKVLKEFPPHELLDTLAAIRDYVGILLDKKV